MKMDPREDGANTGPPSDPLASLQARSSTWEQGGGLDKGKAVLEGL